MIIETANYLTFEVTFSISDREEGFNDDIRFAMRESGPPTTRILRCDQGSLLLTPNQAEQLANALLEAAEQSRATGNRERRTSRAGNRAGALRLESGHHGRAVANLWRQMATTTHRYLVGFAVHISDVYRRNYLAEIAEGYGAGTRERADGTVEIIHFKPNRSDDILDALKQEERRGALVIIEEPTGASSDETATI
ncbi:MAG: hypothetical protein AB9869_24520 [Verrucomicrobiia bacterium]